MKKFSGGLSDMDETTARHLMGAAKKVKIYKTCIIDPVGPPGQSGVWVVTRPTFDTNIFCMRLFPSFDACVQYHTRRFRQ